MRKTIPYILLLSAPLMLIFSLAGLQTIEVSVTNGLPIPWQVFVLLFVVLMWCIGTASCKEKCLKNAMNELNNWIENRLK